MGVKKTCVVCVFVCVFCVFVVCFVLFCAFLLLFVLFLCFSVFFCVLGLTPKPLTSKLIGGNYWAGARRQSDRAPSRARLENMS